MFGDGGGLGVGGGGGVLDDQPLIMKSPVRFSKLQISRHYIIS